jgi:transcription-repair coupling factor (superfamily II helicase)
MKELIQSYSKLIQDNKIIQEYSRKNTFTFYGVPEGAISFISSSIFDSIKNQTIIFISPSNSDAEAYFNEAHSYIPSENLAYLPGPEGIPYDYSHYVTDVKLARINTLSKILENKPCLLFTSVSGFLRTLFDPKKLLSNSIYLKKESEYNLTLIIKGLIDLGYKRNDICTEHGSFSLKGGILDICTPSYEDGIRFDFFGDTLESIKLFDLESQKSSTEIQEIRILPATEYSLTEKEWELYTNKLNEFKNKKLPELDLISKTPLEELISLIHPPVGLLSYFTVQPIFIFSDSNAIAERAYHLTREYKTLYEKRKDEIICEDVSKILSDKLEFSILTEKIGIEFRGLIPSESKKNEFIFKFREANSFRGKIKELREKIEELKSEQIILITSSYTAQIDRLKSLFTDLSFKEIKTQNGIFNFPKENGLYILESDLRNGFHSEEDKFVIWTENDIFGRSYKRKTRFKKVSSKAIQSFIDLKEGDYIVHVHHGIGKFLSIEKVNSEGKIRDFIKLEYAGGDTLFIPLNQIYYIQRYIGGTEKPVLDNLGKGSWKKKKEKAKGVVTRLAEELLVMYSNRMELKGFAYPPDTIWQEEFEADFPFEETPDQISAIDAVKSDMESARPMDRLVCGDVGYGKTEVAIRAAFKAVMAGKQVLFIAPTTILALQHYNSLTSRYKNFPIQVGMVSRFRSNKEIKELIEKFSKGKVDILVGTHALLSPNIKPRNLGLLVIDEEQRFGVNHKESIKKIKNLVDVLTLSATPIPRTLHMSLTGIRDLSIIETPPKNRLSVETYVMEDNEEIMKIAIQKEIEREGQVFYLYNRVESIEQEAEFLSTLLPKISIGILHGKLTEEEVEETIIDFNNKKYDVLVTTTIIESGIDMPNVNTILVKRADTFGLSQLYQIRGRVGRSGRKAYAYLLYPKDKALTESAEKRLNTISEYQELGSGFKVAMRDLEIRGAGNLLGTEQSGSIMDIGFDLYVQMLNEEVSKLKKEKVDIEIRTNINLSANFYIPEEYIQDTKQKIEFYKKLEAAQSIDEVDEIELEILDRFGEYPEAVEIFLLQEKIRVLSSNLGFEQINEEKGEIKFKSGEAFKGNPQKIMKYLNPKYGLSLVPKEPNVLKFIPKSSIIKNRLAEIISILEKISE